MSIEKIQEVKEYADYLQKKYEENILQSGLTKLADKSKSYKFLEEEEDLYTVKDLKSSSN